MNEAGRGDVAILLQRDQQILIQPMDKVRQRKRRNLATGGSANLIQSTTEKTERVSDKSKSLETVCTERRGTKIPVVTIKFRRSQHGDAVRIMQSEIYARLAPLNTPGTGCSELDTRH